MLKVSINEVIDQGLGAIESDNVSAGGTSLDREGAARAIEQAKLLALLSIAQSLDNIMRNGIMVERP